MNALTTANRRTLQTAFAVALLIVLAGACLLIRDYVPRGPWEQLLNCIRIYLYLGLLVVWIVSVRRRVVQTQVRRYLLAAALLMISWLVLRQFKWSFVRDPATIRWLWYLYYVPLLLIPTLTLFVSVSLGRQEHYRLPRAAALLLIPAAANDGGERVAIRLPWILFPLLCATALAHVASGAADSLWYKDHGDRDLMAVIDRTLAGERIFPDASPAVELKKMLSSDISPRQLSILRLFVRGLTYDEIAAELNLSKNGVRWNLEQIVEKGGFANKHELLAAVIENKLIVTTLEDAE